MKFSHFYSDPHFGHASIIGFCDRPYISTDDMNHDLVQRYNAAVKATDTVLWLGDASFAKSDETTDILASMNGKKAIVLGNHDRSAGWFLERGFLFALDEAVFSIEGQRFRASHYPPVGADSRHDDRYLHLRPVRQVGECLIHGHSHSKLRVAAPGVVHVGVDAWDYGPAAVKDVLLAYLSSETPYEA